MFNAIAQVITRPSEFFAALGEDESLARWALPVVLLTTMASALATYLLLLPQQDAFGPDTQIGAFAVQVRVFGTAIIYFLGWLVFGLVIRMAAGIQARPWAVAGYATVPALLFSLVTAAIAVAAPAEVGPVTDITDEQVLQEELTRIEQETQESLPGRANALLSIVGIAWYMALIYIGVKGTTGSPGSAIRATSFIAIVYLLVLMVPWLLAAP